MLQQKKKIQTYKKIPLSITDKQKEMGNVEEKESN